MPAETEIERLVVKFLGDNEQYKKVLKENVKASDQWAVDTTRSLNKVRGEIQTLQAVMADRAEKKSQAGFFKKLVTGFDSEKLNITQQRKLIQEQKALYGSVTKSIVGVDLNKVNQTLDRIERLQQRNFLGNSAGAIAAGQHDVSQLGMSDINKQMDDFTNNLEGQRSADEQKNGVSNETLAREKYIKDTYRLTLEEKEAYRVKQELAAASKQQRDNYVSLAQSIDQETKFLEKELKLVGEGDAARREQKALDAEQRAKDLGENDKSAKRIGDMVRENEQLKLKIELEAKLKAGLAADERAQANNPGLSHGFAEGQDLQKIINQAGMSSLEKKMDDYTKSIIGVDAETKKLMISARQADLEKVKAIGKAEAQTASVKELNTAMYDQIAALKLEAQGYKHVKEEVLLRYAAEKGADAEVIAKARRRIAELDKLEREKHERAFFANPDNQARMRAMNNLELPRVGSMERQQMTAKEFGDAQRAKQKAFKDDRDARAAAFDATRRVGGFAATEEFRKQQGAGRNEQRDRTQALLAEARNRAAARKSNRPGNPDLYMDQLSFFINSLGGTKGHPELGGSGMAADDIIFGDQLGVGRQKFGERKGRKPDREQREMSSGVVAAMEARRRIENRKRQTGGNPDLLLGGMDFLNGGGDANKNKQQAQQRENESTKRRDEQATNKQIGLLERVAKASEEQVKSILLKKILTSGIKA